MYSVTDPTGECYCHQRDQINQKEKRYCKRRKFNKNKTIVFLIVTIINVAYGIRTNNAELKNINVQYSRALPTEPRKKLIAN